MGIVTTGTFTSDTETVTKTKLNDLTANLVTEFNGNIDNDNIKAAAGIVYSKLSLSGTIVKGDLGSSAAMSHTESFDNGDLAAGILTITHSLGRQYVNVKVYDNNDIEIGPDLITATDTNTLTIDLSSFGSLTGTWNLRISA